jgi:putative glutamine amidotransferase
MIKVGIPSTDYSKANGWEPFLKGLFPNEVEAIDLDPNYGRNELPKDIDIVMFDGGADVHPVLYGGTFHKSISVNLERDWQEKIIFDFYKDLDTVFAGICRGAQFLNVMMGGTLYEDLPSINLGHEPKHKVMITDSECLFSYLKMGEGDEMSVNSLHHQAVKDLGDGLTVTMLDSNFGVVEGFQSLDGKIRAVQSHPEMGDNSYIHRIAVCDWLLRTEEYGYG